MQIRVRFRLDNLQRKIDRTKSRLPKEARRELEALAARAVELVNNAPDSERRAVFEKAIERSLDSVFVPVTLKHKRPETWPNLRPIYQARIVQGRRTYDGRRLFWVDENKRDALADDLLKLALEKRKKDVYDVRFVATYDNRFRVEIVRRGGGRVPSAVVAFARQRMKAVAVNTAAAALSAGGLTKGKSAGRGSHRHY